MLGNIRACFHNSQISLLVYISQIYKTIGPLVYSPGDYLGPSNLALIEQAVSEKMF